MARPADNGSCHMRAHAFHSKVWPFMYQTPFIPHCVSDRLLLARMGMQPTSLAVLITARMYAVHAGCLVLMLPCDHGFRQLAEHPHVGVWRMHCTCSSSCFATCRTLCLLLPCAGRVFDSMTEEQKNR